MSELNSHNIGLHNKEGKSISSVTLKVPILDIAIFPEESLIPWRLQ